MTCGSRTIALALLALLAPRAAAAQPDSQLWGELSLRWIGEHFTLGLDTEPKVQISAPADEPGWRTIDVVPSVEYDAGRWTDLLAQLKLGRTKETDDLTSAEVAPRVGVRFHVLSNLRAKIDGERQPRHRVQVSNLVRYEWRNFFYSNDQPDESSTRLRDRIELLVALNRPRMTDDGAWYTTSDVEWFWQRGEPNERFASKQRIRAGLGHRRSRAWRFETLYVWDRSRNSADEGFTTADHALDLIVKRVW